MGGKRITTESFTERAQALHGCKYSYGQVVFASSHQKVTIVCPQHGAFAMTAANHLNGQGCPQCKNARIGASQRGTTQDFVVKASVVHQGQYQYHNVAYTKAYDKVWITCPDHGDFLQAPATHLEGSGCPSCAKRPKVDTQEFVSRAQHLHGGKYDYSRAVYINAKRPVEIVCPVHGSFFMPPHRHSVIGSGCNACGSTQAGARRRFTTAQFITMATEVHKGKYTYEGVNYIKASQKVAITCPKHGVFLQKPNHHFAGFGCPSCRGIVSKPEHEIVGWLRARGVLVEQSRRDIIPPKELDIYLPEHKLAIEYCGMYWHSHKNVEEELKHKTDHWNKYKACEARGIRLITLYETEWRERKPVIKRLLRAATGKLRGRLMARKCDLAVVSVAEAKVFFEAYHPQGGAGGGVYYGLYWKGALVACMRFAQGINDRGHAGKNRGWTLSRYATRFSVAGGAGRLLRAFQEEHDYPSIKSFSDNRLFSGGMYGALGFQMVEESGPDYAVWSQKLGLRPKAAYQRRELAKRLTEHGLPPEFSMDTDLRTEQEMTYFMGAARIYDCGKKKWVLDARARLA